MSRQLYTAYGIGLDRGKVFEQYPTAKPTAKGWLFDYRLVFQGADKKALANIIPQKGGEVPVIFWAFDPADEKSLDKAMAAAGYTKGTMQAEVAGEMQEVVVFTQAASAGYGLPGRDYLYSIEQGYKDFRFPTDILWDAVRYSIETIEQKA